jgi:hypothetical protein
MMEAVRTSETSVNSYQFIWRYNPEDSHLHSHRHENPKACTILSFLLRLGLLSDVFFSVFRTKLCTQVSCVCHSWHMSWSPLPTWFDHPGNLLKNEFVFPMRLWTKTHCTCFLLSPADGASEGYWPRKKQGHCDDAIYWILYSSMKIHKRICK